MPFTFANPLALWALCGIPAILLIHFLQRRAKQFPVSTLFLLSALDRSQSRGRRFDRLSQSLPLWLQILGVLLLTWILVEPRWPQDHSIQRVVVVLDDSASMSVFREPLSEALKQALGKLSSSVSEVEYSMIPSTQGAAPIYRGNSLPELLMALQSWQPTAGTHSPDLALRVGRGLVGADGILIYATDHDGDPLPADALRLAVGHAIENVGFAGLRTEQENGKFLWQASVRNYGQTAQKRSWRIEAGNSFSEPRTLELKPGETRILRGEFPDGISRLRLILDDDLFSLDDSLYLLRPKRKPLSVAISAPETLQPQITRIIDSLDELTPASETGIPDLQIDSYDPISPTQIKGSALVFLYQPQPLPTFIRGRIVTANHPLMEDLDWQGLIARNTPSIPVSDRDQPLLWQGERPMILLRGSDRSTQLIFNFDLPTSNATQLPAFIVVIHRFIEQMRSAKVAPESRNVELRQTLSLAHLSTPDALPLHLVGEGEPQTISVSAADYLLAPAHPGFFRVVQGEQLLLDGTANFADVREADFSEATTRSEVAGVPDIVEDRHSSGDPLWRVWILLLAAGLLASWLVKEGEFSPLIRARARDQG